MTDHDQELDAGTVARRHLIRGGAVLAGAAGLTAVGAALAPKASAVDGDPLLQGRANPTTGTGTTTTTGIKITDTSSVAPSVTLSHANQDAPQLALTPRPLFDDPALLPELKAGEILNTNLGPYIGLSDGATTPTVVTGTLATNFDLDAKAESVAVTPRRALDTRTSAGRSSIRAKSSTAALDSSFRLRRGAWIDIVVDTDSSDYVTDAAFVNITAIGTLAAGPALEIYSPTAIRAGLPSVYTNDANGMSNAAFVQVSLSATNYLIRIFGYQTTHVLVDVTGYARRGPSAEPITNSSNARRRSSMATKRVVRSTRKR